MLEARGAIRNLPEYHPPLGGRLGLRLDFNENVAGCSPLVLERIRSLTASEIACYPDREPLERLLAGRLGVEPSELLLTSGTDEAIHLLCETFLEPGDEVLIVVPTFAMYEISARATGAHVLPVPASEDFAFPRAELLSRVTSRTRLIAIANPNNPTGAVVEEDILLGIAQSIPHAAVLVDEAYFEFYGKTLLKQSRQFPNLFVARTFSKAYGMAGLRVGVLTGHPVHLGLVRRASSPYNVNTVALACLPAALQDTGYVRQYVSQVSEGRAALVGELRAWGIPCWPSQANFVLARLGPIKNAFVDSMRAHGILVRDRSSDYGCANCVRITLGTRELTARLLATMHSTLRDLGAGKTGFR